MGNGIAPLAGGKRLAEAYLSTVYKIGLYQIIKSGIIPGSQRGCHMTALFPHTMQYEKKTMVPAFTQG